jgi:hypothetical protein
MTTQTHRIPGIFLKVLIIVDVLFSLWKNLQHPGMEPAFPALAGLIFVGDFPASPLPRTLT